MMLRILNIGVLYAALLLTISLPTFAQSSNGTLAISQDGSCGGNTTQTCLASTFGNCCSSKGYCGATGDYCGKGCQSAFGSCSSSNASFVSNDGFCGSKDPNHQSCIGSQWGPCCSGRGYCGDDINYCGSGCQPGYGTCGGANMTVTTSSATDAPTSSATSTPTASSAAQQTSPAAQAQPVTESVGFKAGMGILGGVLGLALIGLIAFLLRRRQQKKHHQLPSYEDDIKHFNETASEAPTAPHTAHGENGYAATSRPPPVPKQYEMDSASQSRYELDHKGAGVPVEMASERY